MQKLLWHSNAPWAPTGYGAQTGLFAPYLKQHYDLALSSFYGLEGAHLNWGGIPVLPGAGANFGNAFVDDHAKRHFGSFKGGLVVTLLDVWVLNPELGRKLNMACWTPVDHEPPIPVVVKFLKTSGVIPIAMSKFGETQLRTIGFDPLYVPHAVDTQVYQPADKAEIRQQVGIPQDAFMVGMVAANKGVPSRKGFQQALQAFRLFHMKHPDSVFYLHTNANPQAAGGEDIEEIVRSLGLSNAVRVADSYRMMFDPWPPDSMARIYSAFDVLLNPSMGEGFGVPILEAQACGVPAIVTNFSSMPEVCGTGWHVGCRPWWTPGKSWQAIPDVEEIADALETCYARSNSEVKLMASQARRHALGYDIRKVMAEHMLPALSEVAQRFEDRKPLAPVKVAA